MFGHSKSLLEATVSKVLKSRQLISAFALGAALSGPALATDIFADPVPGDGPALYAVSDENTTIYVYGTFHVLPPAVEWQTDAFNEAMAATSLTIIEADIHSPQAQAEVGALIQELGMNPPGVRLTDTLGPERTEVLQGVLNAYGVPLDALQPLRPWLATLTLAQLAYAQAGFDLASGVEQVVLAQASEEGDSLGYLETASFQARALASLDEEEVLGGFDVGIDTMLETHQITLDAVAAWSVGDVEALNAILVDETLETAPGVYEIIFANRNRNWADQIEGFLAEDQDAFIAVGAGHLYGPENVLTLLAERGVTVERLQ